MVNTFKLAQDTLIVDGLTYEQMVDLNSFIYHKAFERFYHTEYVRQPDGGIFGTRVYQIVAQGNAKDLFMLEILAGRINEIETARTRTKFTAKREKVCDNKTLRRLLMGYINYDVSFGKLPIIHKGEDYENETFTLVDQEGEIILNFADRKERQLCFDRYCNLRQQVAEL